MVARTTPHGDATIMKVMARSRVGDNAAPNSTGTTSSSKVTVTIPTE